MVWIISNFSFEVSLKGKPYETFKIQIPPRVSYTVICNKCEHREGYSFGVRYVEIKAYTDGKVEVVFPEPKVKPSKIRDFRTHIILNSVLNPNSEWVEYRTFRPQSIPQNPFSKSEVWIKVKITKSGIYEIPFSEIEKLGININSYPLQTFKMIALLDTLKSPLDSAFSQKYEIPIWVDEAGKRIIFWGEAQKGFRIINGDVAYFENPYTDTTYYFLGIGGENGKRIGITNISPGPSVQPAKFYRFEENINNPGKKGRVWVGREMTRNPSDPERVYTYQFVLNDVSSGIEFKTRIANSEFSDSIASVVVKINGQVCDSVGVLPRSYRTITCIPNLSENNNVDYVIKPSGGSQTLYLDYYQVSYVSTGTYGNDGLFFINASGKFTVNLKGYRPVFIWDVSDPYNPKVIESYTYSSGNLFINDSANGWTKIYLSNFARRPISIELVDLSQDLYNISADYVAIGNEEFSGTFWKHLNFRKNRIPVFNGSSWEYSTGTVLWINLEDIYTQFSLGNPDPVAIRNFLYNMFLKSGGSKPLYVVLVGDGTYDYKGFTENYFPKQVPPYYPIDSSLSVNLDNFGAYDDFYGDFDGDYYSDVGIGRIPVRDNTELAEYINKVIEYESLINDGFWRYRIMFVADDEKSDSPSSCEIFHTYDVLYTVRPQLSPRINTIPFLLQNYPLEGYTKPKATQDLIKILNSGILMVSFFIHGNPSQMAHERLFTLDDVPKLNTKGREPFITVLSCKVGAYDRLDPEHVLGEEMMLYKNRGIAVLSTTALAYAGSNALYARAIYSYLNTYGKTPLGYLSLVGKNDRYYVLLGDPGVMLKFPDSVGPLISDTLRRGAKNSTTIPGDGKFLVLDIPDIDTVSFTCVSVKYPYYSERPVIFYGDVKGDTVGFWIPFRGHISSDTSAWQRASLLWWNGDRGYAGLYPISYADSTIGTEKPKVLGFYKDEGLRNGMNLPSKTTLNFRFISHEGFDIRTTGDDASPPRIIIDNSFTDVLEVRILNDTLAEAHYDFDFSTSPGTHRIGVSITSAKGIRGYNIWDLNFVSDSLKVLDLLTYPNPYRGGKFYITFKLTKSADVKLRIYTPTGKVAFEWYFMNLPPGFNSLNVPINSLSNGIYVALIEAKTREEKVKNFTRFVVIR